MKTGIINKGGYFAAGRVAQSFRKFRPEGLNGYDLFTPLERRRGLPIGNLTSQWFANWALTDLDHYVTSRSGIGGYVRYCDNFILLHNDRELLREAREAIKERLALNRFTLHEQKLFVRPVRAGLTFVGYRLWPTHRLLRKPNIKDFRRRVRWMREHYASGKIGWDYIKPRLTSWMGHAQNADSKLLIRRLSREWKFTRDGTDMPAGDSRRRVEQQCNQLPGRGAQQQHAVQSEQQQQRISIGPALSDCQNDVIPAQAGIHNSGDTTCSEEWTPAFAGVTINQARNRGVYGSCERGFESPGLVPEPCDTYSNRGPNLTMEPGGASRNIIPTCRTAPLFYSQNERLIP